MSLCWITEVGCDVKNLAPWAQAIGTFLAIIFATWIGRVQIKQGFNTILITEKISKCENAKTRLIALRKAINWLRVSFENYEKTFNSVESNTNKRKKLLEAFDSFGVTINHINNIPLNELYLEEIVEKVSEIHLNFGTANSAFKVIDRTKINHESSEDHKVAKEFIDFLSDTENEITQLIQALKGEITKAKNN